MNDENRQPVPAPLESYDEGRSLPVSIHGDTMIQTTGEGSVARKIAPPRDLPRVMQAVKVGAAMAGESWYFRWPVKNKNGTTDWIEGPSIKCATAVARMYGNCEVNCIQRESQTHYIFEATFVDLETGFTLTRPFQQRKSQNLGKKMDAGRQEDIIYQIGVSKATRNVINNALETFTDFAFDEARKSLVAGIGKNLEGSRARILSMFAENKIDVKRVEFVYAKKSSEWLAPDIAKMIAEVRAIVDGMANKDEAYPPTPEEAAEHDKAVAEAQGQQSGEARDATPPSDWDAVVGEFIAGLQACKSSVEVNKFIDDNQPSCETLSKAPHEINKKWTAAFQAKMKELAPKKDDKTPPGKLV